MQPRTKRQKEVLDYITKFVDRNGYEPSYQQIARQLGVASKGGIQRHIVALENQGLIARKRENGSFGIEIRSKQFDSEMMCMIELVETIEQNGLYTNVKRSTIAVPRFFIGPLHPDEIFAFKTPDDSMSDRHVCEGDIALVERKKYASRGEIVVVHASDGQMLMGRYYQHGLKTEIRPASEHFESSHFPADEVVIEGVLRGLLRPIPDASQS